MQISLRDYFIKEIEIRYNEYILLIEIKFLNGKFNDIFIDYFIYENVEIEKNLREKLENLKEKLYNIITNYFNLNKNYDLNIIINQILNLKEEKCSN